MSDLGAVLIGRVGERAAALDRRPRTHRAILLALPAALTRRFDPESAGDLEALLELRVRDPGGGPPARFSLRISGGRCEARPAGVDGAPPGASAEIGADDLIRLVSGAVGWPQLLAAGRLELAGDPFLALRFPNLFRLPAGD
jgi:SCP-2 sterol transfer family